MQVWLIPIAYERVGVQVKLCDSWEHVPYLSASEVVFDKEALYQVYIPLPYIYLRLASSSSSVD